MSQLPDYCAGGKADWSLIPERMRGGLRRYIENGIPPGGFLSAVLCNDLRGAVERGDDENQMILHQYIRFLYNYAPAQCWGSEAKFKAWVEAGGMGWKEIAA